MQLPDFSAARILVVGDLMLDRCWSGATERISPEAPVPVVHVRGEEERPGGAGNVALNIAALGARVELIGHVGDDDAGAALRAGLTRAGVAQRLVVCAGSPTTVKLRVVSRRQHLLRLDFEAQRIDRAERAALRAQFEAALADADIVLFSDYGKGALAEVEALIAAARARGVPALVDPKGEEFARYRDATLITPNRAEFEAAANRYEMAEGGHAPVVDGDETLEERGERLRAALRLEALLITRGERGMTLLRGDAAPLHRPARARAVYDVVGAGDTVIALLAAGMAAGLDLVDAVDLANCAAGIVVGKPGAAVAALAELRRALAHAEERESPGGEGDDAGGVCDEETLVAAVAAARARGERVVVTNGCFDLLHAGHVAYLEEARRLGDRLVVLVNSDASARRLKGEGRPVNDATKRMALLAALRCVDWVAPFDDDTPVRLLRRLRPDLLVKGGDYRSDDEIVGADAVRENGGEARRLGCIEGLSTSRIIDRIVASAKR